MTTEQNLKEAPGYRQHPAISNSDLKVLVYSPQVFKKYKEEQEKSEPTPAQHLGSMVDMYLLDRETFDKTYAYRPSLKKPQSPNQEKFLTLLSSHDPFLSEEESNQLLIQDYGQCYKLSSKDMANGHEIALQKAKALKEEYSEYLEFLTDDRVSYNEEQKEILEAIEANCMSHPIVGPLFNPEGRTYEFSTHKRIIDIDLNGVMMKGELDILVVDREKKSISIYDLKTTSKRLADFPQEFMKYEYHVQQSLYLWLTIKELEDEIDENWSVACYIIAAETKSPNSVSVFPIPTELLRSGFSTIKERVELYKFHREHGFDGSKSFYENDGLEIIDWNDYA